jgi:ABC-type proline/glycine betaine transport system permease subunit
LDGAAGYPFAAATVDESDDPSSSERSWRARRIRIPRTDVGVYLETIPAFVMFVLMPAVVWLGYGTVVAGPVVAATSATDTPAWALTGAGVVFVSEGGQTVVEYFTRGGYRDTSAYGAVKGIFWQ